MHNDANVNIGDLVRLRSGGPDMTVMELADGLNNDEGLNFVTCVWFNEADDLCSEDFPLAALNAL